MPPWLQELNKQYEAKTQKCTDLRNKLKECKAALSARSRELEVATKMLQKVADEKKHLQVSYLLGIAQFSSPPHSTSLAKMHDIAMLGHGNSACISQRSTAQNMQPCQLMASSCKTYRTIRTGCCKAFHSSVMRRR